MNNCVWNTHTRIAKNNYNKKINKGANYVTLRK